MPTIIQKGVFGIPIQMINDSIGVIEINRKFAVSGASSGAAIALSAIEQVEMQSAQMQQNSVLTLPNGAIYDVSQTYNAPHVMRPINFSYKIFSQNTVSDLHVSNATLQVNQLATIIGERVTLFVSVNKAMTQMYKILCRLNSVEAGTASSYGFALNTVNVNLIPVETEWTFTTTLTV